MNQTIQPDMPSFEPMGRLVRARRVTDADYIERTRKTLLWWDRWRWVGIVLCVMAIAGVIWIGVTLGEFLREFQPPAPVQNAVAQKGAAEMLIFLGVGIGASIGFSMHHCFWSLIMALSGMRSERLLVRYHAEFGDLPEDSN